MASQEKQPHGGSLTRPAKGETMNPNGRPRKTIAAVNKELEEMGFTAATKTDILDCYMRLINVDMAELTKIVNDKTQPAMIRIVGKSIVNGKGIDVIEKILDRGIGRPQNTIDHTTKGKEIKKSVTINYNNLDEKTLEDLINNSSDVEVEK